MPESLPPLTAADLRVALNNPTFTLYLYVGGAADRGWKIAQGAFGLLPALRVYLVASRDLIPDWSNGPEARGVVFGYGPNPRAFLTLAQAEDLSEVVDAIAAARKP